MFKSSTRDDRQWLGVENVAGVPKKSGNCLADGGKHWGTQRQIWTKLCAGDCGVLVQGATAIALRGAWRIYAQ